MKLKLEVRAVENATILSCSGRIAFGREVAALSKAIAELLPHTRRLVIDLSHVEMIDSAGLGELVVVLMWAQASGCLMKLANPIARVRQMFELTNLVSVFEIYPALEDALRAFPAPALASRVAHHAA